MIACRNQERWKNYLNERCEEAFNQVVAAHIDLVYGVALRTLAGDLHMAKDATQSVFIDLARKRPKLDSDAALAGWLYRHTRFTAAKMIRTEQRRRQREQKYEQMKPSQNPQPDSSVERVSPHLDECLQELGDIDRETLLLRFFQKQPLDVLGEGMGISADAAQKRVRRALDRMRVLMEKRGLALTATSLASVMTTQASLAPPVGLASHIVSASLIAQPVGWSGMLAPLHQHLIAMKTSYIVYGATVAVAVPLVYQYQSLASLKREQTAIHQELIAMDSVPAEYAAWQKTKDQLARFEQLQKDLGDKKRLAEEVHALKEDDAERKLQQLAELNDAMAKLNAAEKEKEEIQREIEFKQHQVKIVSAMKHLGLAARIYATEHGDELPTDFEQLENELENLQEQFKNTPLEGFEYFRHERPPHETEPRIILFREVEPRFNGKFYHRVYTFCDGSVQAQTSQTPDFSAFEKPHTATWDNLPDWIRTEKGDQTD